MEPGELLKQGRIEEALSSLQEQVRAKPADAKLRVFLFQLLAVMGDWDRAMTQLNVAAEMDPDTLLMAQVCRPALNCEALRTDIFAGRRAPLVFGEPAEWVGWMIQANQHAAQGEYTASQKLRDRAFEAAPAVAGNIDGTPFEWIADADTRLGPLLEAIIEGRYYWVPFSNIATVVFEEPGDLRDVVWTPALFTWTNGGNTVGLVPSRYAGSENSDDPAIRLSRKTEWLEREGGTYLGLGQRTLATDQGEYPLMATRAITLGEGAPPAEEPAQEPDNA
jgi:type VI secretion system protein ImpE